MKLEKIYLLLPVIILVFFAGCTKVSETSAGGVVIEKLTPQVSTVASNSPVEFTLIVKNTGEREATDVKAVLGGLTFLTPTVSQDIEKYWRAENKGVVTDLLKPLDPNSLLGEDLQSGFKGDKGITTWRLTAPIQARDQTYEPTVNVIYNYSTVPTILIKAVNFNYFQSLSESEQEAVDTGVIVSKTTKGPIEVSVKSDQAVISSFSTLAIEIEFKNIGEGILFTGKPNPEIDEETKKSFPENLYKNIKAGLNTIKVELPKDLQCNLAPEDGKYVIRMVEGKNGRILCRMVIGDVSTTQTFSLDIKAEYRYLLEGKTAVKVSKTLYQPPILDISILDSIAEITAEHLSGPNVGLGLIVKNTGNQEIKGVDIPVKYSVFADSQLIQEDSITVLNQIEPLTPFNSIRYPSDKDMLVEVMLSLEVKQVKVAISTSQLKIGNLEERNLVNNKFDPPKTIDLDYDIAVESLKAEAIGKPNPFSTKITAVVKNNAKNIIARNIPVEIKINNVEIDYPKQCTSNNNVEPTSDVSYKIRIKELKKGASQEVICVYDNSEGKLEFNIVANIRKAPVGVDGNTNNDINDKPNDKPNPFKINYDIAIDKLSSKTENPSTIGNQVSYTLSTKVVNLGTVKAENVQVRFVAESELCATGTSLCENKAEIQKFTSSLGQPATTASCTSKLFSTTEILKAKACVIGVSDEVKKTNNEELFTISYKDTTPPTVGQAEIYQGTAFQSGTDYWYSGIISIKASASDTETSITKCEYTTDNGASWKEAEYDLTNKICKKDNLGDSGKDITINFDSTNEVGLSSTGKSRIYKHTVAPTILLTATSNVASYTFDTWTKNDVTVTISCKENAGVNCKTIKYCANKKSDTDVDKCTPSIEYVQSFLIATPSPDTLETAGLFVTDIKTTEGIIYLRYKITDTLTNIYEKTLKVKIDKTPVEGSGNAINAEEVRVTSPFDGTHHPIASPPTSINGEAKDILPMHVPAQDIRIASGLPANSVTFYLKKEFDNKYWTGATWSSTLTLLPTTHSETEGDTNVLWDYSGNLPDFKTLRKDANGNELPEKYIVRAQATDKAGNTIVGKESIFYIIP